MVKISLTVNRHILHIDDRIRSNILLGTIRSSKIDARADTDIGSYTVVNVTSGFIGVLYPYGMGVGSPLYVYGCQFCDHRFQCDA